MMRIVRTDSNHPHFVELVKMLDAELAIRDGDEHAFYQQYNRIDAINHVVLVYDGNIPVGCGGFKEYSPNAAEIKRMFVPPERRRKGIAARVLSELETWARELAYSECVLETGKRQPEAIALYKKLGYSIIPNYGQYVSAENSVCFTKVIATRNS